MSEISLQTRYRPYPAYRDSGVEWLGEVPEGWEVGRLKRTVADAQNGSWGEESESDEDPICVRVADFNRESFTVIPDPGTRRHYSLAEFEKRRLSPGDLLLEKSGGGEKQPVGAVVIFEGCDPAICSNFVARIRSADGYSARFLAYLHASLYSQRLNVPAIKQNTGIQNLDQDAYLNTSVPLPPLPEQRAIAAFLDRETAKIDTLIAKKERLLELLDEKRTALISQTVTKGLDPDAPMKDSGVEWLGEVPDGWEVKRIRFAARMESGHTPDRKVKDYWEGGMIPWVSLADTGFLRKHDYITETAHKITELGLANSSARLLPPGTVVFSRDATIGCTGITVGEMAVSQHFIGWVCGPELENKYLLSVFAAMTEELESLTTGATLRTIGMPEVNQLVTPVPSVQEQKEINDFLDHETIKIDALKSKIQYAIDLLKEYRTALISAAVTGKIDVRDEVAA